MALCSQVFNKSATKRSCNQSEDLGYSKRICLNKKTYSSSEDDENSEDEQLCYKLNQIKAKRRASSRISFSLQTPNPELTKAISKYSDDEDEDDGRTSDLNDTNQPSPGCHQRTQSNHHSSVEAKSDLLEDFKLFQIPNSDKNARSRCFEYLVSAIDEAWARYCDFTSIKEDNVYNSLSDDESLASFGNSTDDTDLSEVERSGGKMIINNNNGNNNNKASNSTCPSKNQPQTMINNSNLHLSQYQNLKDRLIKAKYFLQDLIDSNNFGDIQSFWNRWDLIKYTTIELVEDDDNDEIIESTVEELEKGRYFVN